MLRQPSHNCMDLWQILDVFQCVERLNDLDAISMRKLVQRERMLAVPRYEKLLPFKVDLMELLTRLPLHLIACVLAQEPKENGMLLTFCHMIGVKPDDPMCCIFM